MAKAELDEMSGVLLCEEKDNTTAYSYFLEVKRGRREGLGGALQWCTSSYRVVVAVAYSLNYFIMTAQN